MILFPSRDTSVSRLFSGMKTAPTLGGILETGGLMQGARGKVHQTTSLGGSTTLGVNHYSYY